MDTTVLELLKRSAAIPSMPQVAIRFLEIVQEPDFEYSDVVEVLSGDPGMASEILRLANSALFGVTREVTSLNQALSLLGIKRVRSLVLGRYIVDSINHKRGATVDPSYYWRRSVTSAVLAARLADTVDSGDREEAFIAGLLADIGVVILDEALPEQYRSVSEQYGPGGKADLADTEQMLMQTTHAEISAAVLEHWQLPEKICSAVRSHPWDVEVKDRPTLALVVGAADRMSKRLCESPTDTQAILDDGRSIVERLGIESQELAQCLEEIEPQIQEFASLLGIDIIGSEVYVLAARSIRDKLAQPASQVA